MRDSHFSGKVSEVQLCLFSTNSACINDLLMMHRSCFCDGSNGASSRAEHDAVQLLHFDRSESSCSVQPCPVREGGREGRRYRGTDETGGLYLGGGGGAGCRRWPQFKCLLCEPGPMKFRENGVWSMSKFGCSATDRRPSPRQRQTKKQSRHPRGVALKACKKTKWSMLVCVALPIASAHFRNVWAHTELFSRTLAHFG